jgi:hypothetical protein
LLVDLYYVQLRVGKLMCSIVVLNPSKYWFSVLF